MGNVDFVVVKLQDDVYCFMIGQTISPLQGSLLNVPVNDSSKETFYFN